MKKLGEFDLQFKDNGSKKSMPVEILVDRENTIVVLYCECCSDNLSSRLPGGVLIPIASTLKNFFENIGMRNLEVHKSGVIMRRTYKGLADEGMIPDLKKALEQSVSTFSKRRKK